MTDPGPFPRGFPRVQGRCPACKHSALFIGDGGYVTCGNLSCTSPCAATNLLETTPPEFPLPIRADGSHAYTSTYCAHGDHAACRLRCKTCNADCLCDCGHPGEAAIDSPALTREELQDLVDSMGVDLYQASDKLDFVREMCDQRDAAGTPITTTDVRGWLAYTGCGGVLRLPDWAVAILATMSGEPADKAATSGDAPDLAGEQP